MRDSDVTLRDAWQIAFRPFIGEYASRLIDIAERHIRRADLQLTLAGESDRQRPSTWRTWIVADDRDLSSPLGLLVDMARESLESLLETASLNADARLRAWAASDVTLLRRLAVYGWTIRSDKTAEEKITWLISTGWLHNYELRGEATRLILATCGTADEDAIAALVEDIRQHWNDDQYAPHRAYELLMSLEKVLKDEA